MQAVRLVLNKAKSSSNAIKLIQQLCKLDLSLVHQFPSSFGCVCQWPSMSGVVFQELRFC